MPYPSVIFSSIQEWENYVNSNIITNGNEEITGLIGNNAYNGAVKFVKQSPLNWAKAAVESGGGDVSLTDNFLGVVVFTGTTPDSLSFGDNFYNEYVFINMTAAAIPLGTPSVYYNTSGATVDSIPANSAVNLFKAANDLWVLGSGGSGGGGSTQKSPGFYIVGTTAGAPIAGASTWTLPAFSGAYVSQLLVNSYPVDIGDAGDGSEYITKPLISDTLTITNRSGGWQSGDKLQFILTVP